jgi:hypothetical protein
VGVGSLEASKIFKYPSEGSPYQKWRDVPIVDLGRLNSVVGSSPSTPSYEVEGLRLVRWHPVQFLDPMIRPGIPDQALGTRLNSSRQVLRGGVDANVSSLLCVPIIEIDRNVGSLHSS